MENKKMYSDWKKFIDELLELMFKKNMRTDFIRDFVNNDIKNLVKDKELTEKEGEALTKYVDEIINSKNLEL